MARALTVAPDSTVDAELTDDPHECLLDTPRAPLDRLTLDRTRSGGVSASVAMAVLSLCSRLRRHQHVAAVILLVLLLLIICCAAVIALQREHSTEAAGFDSPARPSVAAADAAACASRAAAVCPSAAERRSGPLVSSSRGYVAVMYSGTVRTFSVAFHSHLVNLFAPSPYTVHIFAHYGSGRGDWKTPGVEHDHIALYHAFNATLRYYDGYTNLDNQYVRLVDDCLKWSKVDDAVDMESSAKFNYTEALRLIGDRYDMNSIPTSIVGALDSQRQVNQARLDYERASGIKYAWALRMRMDHVMKSNVWEDVFDVQPLVHPTATAAPFLPPSTHPSLDPYLDLSVHPHPPAVHSANFSSLGLPLPWDGGVLHDMRYTPHPLLSLSSADHDSSFFASTNDWWWGVSDQFAMGGSAAMTSYSERFNVPLIELLAREPNWKLWAEPLVAQVAIVDGLRVVPFRHVYNVLRHIATRPSSWSHSYTPSRCVWIWYGQEAMSEHCPHWLSRQQRLFETMLAASDDSVEQQIADEPYANTGNNARRALLAYVDAVNSAAAATPATSLSSSYYYFWRYRSAKQLLRCEQPAHSVYPEIAASPEAVQPPEHPPFDPFLHSYLPFIAHTSDEQARNTYRQHQTCEQQ